MKKTSAILQVAGAIGIAWMLVPMPSTAANESTAVKDKSATTSRPDSDSDRLKPWNDAKGALLSNLKVGQEKAFYAKALADSGYKITSINADKSDYVEYEVVKGTDSWEVQVDFDKGARRATKVDVTSNLWRTDATKAAMRGTDTPVATAYVPGNEAHSDRANMKSWSSEKDRLQKSLNLGRDVAYYQNELKKMGYQITSTLKSTNDEVEYEVVKGKDTYEVQIDLEAGKAKKVDVTTNMWQSDETERALATTTTPKK